MLNLEQRPASSTARLQKMIDVCLDVICSIDTKGRFVDVSKASIQVWGYHPEELIGRNYMELVEEEGRANTANAIYRCIEDSSGANFENRFYRKDGSIIPLLWSGKWDSDEKLMFCVAKDASERIAREKLCINSEQGMKHRSAEMSEMLECITDGFISLDTECRITYLNPQVEKMAPIRREDFLNKNLWDTFPGLTSTIFYEQYQKVVNEKVSVHYEAYFAPFEIWVAVNAYPSDNGISVFFRNITEERKVKEELQKLSLIVRETANIVVIMDMEGKITWLNNAAIRKAGYTLEEAVGKSPRTLLGGPETDPETDQYIQEQMQKGESFRVEALNYSKTKEKFWIDILTQPVFDAEGKVKQYFAVGTDITERKMLQEQLLEEQKNRQKMITAAAINIQERERAKVGLKLHDNVNQVLTTVKLYLEMCRDGIADPKVLMNKSIHLVQESINEIRSLSKRLSAPSLGKILLKESVQELIDTVSASGKIAFTLDSANINGLDVDRELHLAIYRILQEHLSNILKHSDANNVHVVFGYADAQLTLEVIDDGKGFDIKQQRSSIGITNMLTRAESLQGTLTINSAPGIGSVLTARFPHEQK